MTVLVITSRADTTADFVVNTFNRRDRPVLRLDFAEFPMGAEITARFDGQRWHGRLATDQRAIQLDELTGIYYRRPTNPVLPADMTQAEREFASREIRLGYGGLLSALPEHLWVNHPRRLAAAEASKPWQLDRASAGGLLVPRTLITSDPDEAAEFVSEVGGGALKPFGNGGFSDDAGYRIAYARRVTTTDVRDESIRLTAHQLQEWVEIEFAVRLITVDRLCFAAAILPGSAKAHIDWRSDYDALAYKPVDPPSHVYDGIQSLHADLGLRFSASDFLVDRHGAWWFLETNPNGQWAWIDCLADDISSAIATALMEGSTHEHV
jgi:ATP-grasp ribosomal peptide maturase